MLPFPSEEGKEGGEGMRTLRPEFAPQPRPL